MGIFRCPAAARLSDVARTLLQRLILEFQRRYCGNTTERTIEGLMLCIGDRELVLTYMD